MISVIGAYLLEKATVAADHVMGGTAHKHFEIYQAAGGRSTYRDHYVAQIGDEQVPVAFCQAARGRAALRHLVHCR